MTEVNGNGKIIKVITQTGAIGISVAILWVLWNIVGNHIDHNTKALQEVNVVQVQVLGAVENLNDSTKENTEVLRDLKTWIK